jgi:hypothetical protein
MWIFRKKSFQYFHISKMSNVIRDGRYYQFQSSCSPSILSHNPSSPHLSFSTHIFLPVSRRKHVHKIYEMTRLLGPHILIIPSISYRYVVPFMFRLSPLARQKFLSFFLLGFFAIQFSVNKSGIDELTNYGTDCYTYLPT